VCAENQHEDFVKTKVDTNAMAGEARLVIATLPFDFFHALFLTKPPVTYKEHKTLWKERMILWEVIDSQLGTLGWKREVPDVHGISDPWIRMEHKYCEVQCREI